MSRMIQAATGSPYSHVGFLLHLAHLERWMVLESVESVGIRACSLSTYVRDYNGTGAPYPGKLYLARHQGIDLSHGADFTAFSRVAINLLGYPYDTREILGITARIVAHKLGMTARPPRTSRTYICSEFAALCFESVGVHISYDELGFIAPKHFAECPDVVFLWEIQGHEEG